MGRNKIRTRQRTYLTTRIVIVATATVSALSVFMLFIYFNFSEIKDTKAFSSGDYRVVASGNWDDTNVWEIFDGENWNSASEPPGDGVRNIVVTGGKELIITEEIPVNYLKIEENAKVIIESNTIVFSKFNNAGGIICNGILDLGSSILEGNGDFILGAKGVLMIGSDAGIDKKGVTGNIQMSGKKEFNKDATYVFNGTILQRTGNGIPPVIKNIIINNNSGVVLDQNLQILQTLILENGVLSTGRNILTLGSSIQSTCLIEKKSGALSGTIKIWFGQQNCDNLNFPLADSPDRYNLHFVSEQPIYRKGLIELTYKEGIPDDSQKSPFEARQVVAAITGKGYFSAMLSNGPEEAWLQLSKSHGPDSVQDIKWNILKKDYAATSENTASVKAGARVARVKSISNILYGPVPFSNRLVVRFYSDIKTTASIQLTTAQGKLIRSENINVEEGYNQYVFSGSEKLTEGDCIVQLSNPSEIHTFKVQCKLSGMPDSGS